MNKYIFLTCLKNIACEKWDENLYNYSFIQIVFVCVRHGRTLFSLYNKVVPVTVHMR